VNDLVKKNGGLPSLEMPQLPDIFSRLMPAQTPELTFDKGLIRGTVHKWKLKRMAEVSGHEATIAENRTRVTVATSQALQEAILFGPRIGLQMKEIEHAGKMMDLAEKKEEALTAQEVYKAKILEIDFKDADLTYKLKLKELGDAIQDEDR
jgi:hypothetical protein